MRDDCTPHCPCCGKPSATPSGLRAYYCHACKLEFDPVDDGDFGYTRPETNAMRKDEREHAQRDRLLGKRPAGKLRGGLGR